MLGVSSMAQLQTSESQILFKKKERKLFGFWGKKDKKVSPKFKQKYKKKEEKVK